MFFFFFCYISSFLKNVFGDLHHCSNILNMPHYPSVNFWIFSTLQVSAFNNVALKAQLCNYSFPISDVRKQNILVNFDIHFLTHLRFHLNTLILEHYIYICMDKILTDL